MKEICRILSTSIVALVFLLFPNFAFSKTIVICPGCDSATFQEAANKTNTPDYVVWQVIGYSEQNPIGGYKFTDEHKCPDVILTFDRSSISAPGLTFEKPCVSSGTSSSTGRLEIFGFKFKNSQISKSDGTTPTNFEYNCFEGKDAGYSRSADNGADSSSHNFFKGNSRAFNFTTISNDPNMFSTDDVIVCEEGKDQYGIFTYSGGLSSSSIRHSYEHLKVKNCKLVVSADNDTTIRKSFFTNNELILDVNGRITITMEDTMILKNGINAVCGSANGTCNIFSLNRSSTSASIVPTLLMSGSNEVVDNGGILFAGGVQGISLSGLFDHKGDGTKKRMFSDPFGIQAFGTISSPSGASNTTLYAALEKLPFNVASRYGYSTISKSYISGFEKIEAGGGKAKIEDSEFVMGKDPAGFEVSTHSFLTRNTIGPSNYNMNFGIFGAASATGLTDIDVQVSRSTLPAGFIKFTWPDSAITPVTPPTPQKVQFFVDNWGPLTGSPPGTTITAQQLAECSRAHVSCDSFATPVTSVTPRQPSTPEDFSEVDCPTDIDKHIEEAFCLSVREMDPTFTCGDH